jgi:hypothetical protein
MKFLITIALIYLVYRFFFARPAIPQSSSFQDPARPDSLRKTDKPKDGEYTDYEEVD